MVMSAVWANDGLAIAVVAEVESTSALGASLEVVDRRLLMNGSLYSCHALTSLVLTEAVLRLIYKSYYISLFMGLRNQDG